MSIQAFYEIHFCGNKRKTEFNGWNKLLTQFLNPECSQSRFLDVGLEMYLDSRVRTCSSNWRNLESQGNFISRGCKPRQEERDVTTSMQVFFLSSPNDSDLSQ